MGWRGINYGDEVELYGSCCLSGEGWRWSSRGKKGMSTCSRDDKSSYGSCLDVLGWALVGVQSRKKSHFTSGNW